MYNSVLPQLKEVINKYEANEITFSFAATEIARTLGSNAEFENNQSSDSLCYNIEGTKVTVSYPNRSITISKIPK